MDRPDVSKTGSAGMRYSTAIMFPGQFYAQGESDCDVSTLVLNTRSSTLGGGIVLITQTLTGSSVTDNPEKGLNSTVAVAYGDWIQECESPYLGLEDIQAHAGVLTHRRHTTVLSQIVDAYKNAPHILPAQIEGLEFISD